VSNITVLDDSSYSETIAFGVVVVDFYADWCGPCKMMAPVFDEAQAEYEGKALFCKVNVDECRDIAMSNSIMSIPTLLFFKDGEIKDRVSGVLDKGTLYGKINSLL